MEGWNQSREAARRARWKCGGKDAENSPRPPFSAIISPYPVKNAPVNYAFRSSGPVTALNPRFGIVLAGLHQPSARYIYAVLLSPPLSHQPSSSFPPPLFHIRGVLMPQASGEFLRPSPTARSPTERYDKASQKNASTRLLAVIRSRSR